LRSRTESLLWMVAGGALVALVAALVFGFHEDPAQALASKASRADLVSRMQFALASEAEAEKSAVLATTDEDSVKFADQARAAATEVEGERQELGKRLASDGTQTERELLAQFSEAFVRLKQVDEEVLALAVKNTNLKAYDLAFGPAAETLAEIDAALSRIVDWNADSPNAGKVMALASGAQVAALRVQALLAPHIAEESDEKMERLEARMAGEESQVRKALDGLAGVPGLRGDADLAAARSGFLRYGELKARILALSRENTNVRSLALSLTQKRKAMILCLEPLGALQQAIANEPVPGLGRGKPILPR
jgi:hypothetical protein